MCERSLVVTWRAGGGVFRAPVWRDADQSGVHDDIVSYYR